VFNEQAGKEFPLFDEVFRSVDVISLQRPNSEPEGAIHLVRAGADPEENPDHKHFFIETNGDIQIKTALERLLGLKVGPWSVRRLEYE
jgi:hypothetical protein